MTPQHAFQSTRPVWAATSFPTDLFSDHSCFNPRGPCGPRPSFVSAMSISVIRFNPRGPCGPRPAIISAWATDAAFQSTRPVWAATVSSKSERSSQASFNPRGPCGPRPEKAYSNGRSAGFNPRGPCGPRPDQHGWLCRVPCFNPRGPCGPRRWMDSSDRTSRNVSIHAARVGRDFRLRPGLQLAQCFNPRGPCGPRRAARNCIYWAAECFNPRGPCGPRP